MRLGLKLAATALVFGLTTAAQAAIVANESFDTLSNGNLGGQGSGIGWSGNWVDASSSANDTVVPTAPSLSYTVPGGGVVDGGAKALQHTGNANTALYRTLSSTYGDSASENAIYISFLIKFTGSISGNDFAAIWFDNGVAGGDHSNRPNIGLKANQGSGSTGHDFFTRLALGDESYSGDLVAGETYLIVGRLSKSGSGNFDTFDLWVNPDGTDYNTPDVTASHVGTIDKFDTLGIRSANLANGDTVMLDQITLGTDWYDVVPGAVPEPATLAVLGAGLFGLAWARRRRG